MFNLTAKLFQVLQIIKLRLTHEECMEELSVGIFKIIGTLELSQDELSDIYYNERVERGSMGCVVVRCCAAYKCSCVSQRL